MKKRKLSIKELKLNKMGFKSRVSIYKEKFSDNEITFRPKFSVTKNITFSSHKKTAHNLSKPFTRLKPFK